MGFSEIEKTEQRLHMNPAVAENGEWPRIIINGSTKQAGELFSPKPGHFPHGLSNNGKEKLAFNVKNLSLVLNVILIISIIILIILIRSTGLSGRSAVLPTALPSPSTPTECCPDGWIGYQRKCYYFSDSDRNWTSSQNYCASFNASLVVIDSQEEMSFLRRYKGPADHWIGLQKMNDQGPWKWIDGSIFNNGFEIRGGGESAYINRQGVASSSRLSKERWICSKPVHRGERTLAVH
ncbi:C-type lectin domain family 2 member D-like isoform X1 [Podarcis raffonei]|uniref:C-type lectin domain family 2 member D-like isoform X1 n=1 Tax=Podarcis raffonei TaxID=65483 RepID=UPI00232975CC|nr:C-type lectin domain family 2 member D-like isoform X1 [Podarcis raffonei]XP_053234652.1 C-type lectin domain family 2 member D-like isoform X1 [Podarcis raffonei]XP_053234653.1 C-type lectin domain family 2 member D-like isoform X1 [Podarcis raffonei]XP_053234654.1 C-type lectin domain family 2 member D-like isoform X1 [Podarcis raffonei]XP_053234655.1 C-type lectin domain family 2 member D-like isoform X1 [Podarcis raffonei]XP_053234656.1 C-type lectin domain family 2 member D-like isofor